jgi:uncharacterized membrane protein YdjX (TVP38/TMEM64 family)
VRRIATLWLEPRACDIGDDTVRLLVFAVLAFSLLLGHVVRSWLGIEEMSPAGVRSAVQDLGWTGPAVFFCLVFFRQFLAMPAWLLLPAGGLCFGVPVGTMLGGGAIVGSGALKFWIARWLGRDWVRARFGERFRRIDERVDRLGPLVIGLSAAHPLGLLAPFHWGAGLSSLSFAPFVLALVLGAPVRAFALSTLGASLVEGRTAEFWTVALVLAALMVAPLASPAVRHRVFGTGPN